jgi:uncharacterized pyridoxamine 5'-phosphate oxidase family protein
MRSITNEEVLAFLRSVAIASVAVIRDGKPVSSVVLFTIDDDFTIYFVARKNSYKAVGLTQQNDISLSVWEHLKLHVQIYGIAYQMDEVDFDQTLSKIVRASMVLKDFWPPVLQIPGDEYIVYKIKPLWVRIFDLTDQTIHKDAPFIELQLT